MKETKNVSSFNDVVTNRMDVLAGMVKTIYLIGILLCTYLSQHSAALLPVSPKSCQNNVRHAPLFSVLHREGRRLFSRHFRRSTGTQNSMEKHRCEDDEIAEVIIRLHKDDQPETFYTEIHNALSYLFGNSAGWPFSGNRLCKQPLEKLTIRFLWGHLHNSDFISRGILKDKNTYMLEPLMDLPKVSQVKWEGVEDSFARKLGRIWFDDEAAYPDMLDSRKHPEMTQEDLVRERLPMFDWDCPLLAQNVVLKITKQDFHWYCNDCFGVDTGEAWRQGMQNVSQSQQV